MFGVRFVIPQLKATYLRTKYGRLIIILMFIGRAKWTAFNCFTARRHTKRAICCIPCLCTLICPSCLSDTTGRFSLGLLVVSSLWFSQANSRYKIPTWTVNNGPSLCWTMDMLVCCSKNFELFHQPTFYCLIAFCQFVTRKPSYRWQTRTTRKPAKIAPIRRPYNVVADNTGLSSCV